MKEEKDNQIEVVLPSGLTISLCHIAGGTFLMGGSDSEREQPIHKVTVPPFYLAQYPVTQELYQAVTGENPFYFQGAKRPVERVSWDDTQIFIQQLNQITGKTFRLPSEAEWEFAARGGIHSQGYEYCGSDELKQVAWYGENSVDETKPIGLLLPNELGLYDMSGNVYEWCEDDWHGSYDNPSRPDDGSAWVDGTDADSRGRFRVLRGGSYFISPVGCRPAYRNYGWPGYRHGIIGFRLAMSLQSVGAGSAFP